MALSRRAQIIGAAVLLGVVVGLTLGLHDVIPSLREYDDLRRQVSLYSRPFEPYVQSLRDAGVAVDLDEVDGPMPADADNAAGEIDAAWQFVLDTVGDQGKWPAQALWQAKSMEAEDAVAAATPALRAQMEQFLERLRPFFDRVDRALDRPHLRYPRSIDEATGLHDDPWLPRIQRVVHLLVQAAHAASNPQDRMRGVRDLARLGARIDPIDEMHAMFGVAATKGAVTELRCQVERGTIDPTLARGTLDELLARPWFPRMAAFLRSARAEVIWQARALRAQTQDPAAMIPFVAASEVLGEAATWTHKGYPAWHRDFEDLLARTGMRARGSSEVVQIFVPVVARAFAHADARTRLARIALAAAEHRRTHGDYPASLDELKSSFGRGVPTDPFTDAPFVYARTDAGVRIASAGRVPEDDPVDETTLRERCLVWDLPR